MDSEGEFVRAYMDAWMDGWVDGWVKDCMGDWVEGSVNAYESGRMRGCVSVSKSSAGLWAGVSVRGCVFSCNAGG